MVRFPALCPGKVLLIIRTEICGNISTDLLDPSMISWDAFTSQVDEQFFIPEV